MTAVDDVSRFTALKKVTADMQTHKNPNLKVGGPTLGSPTGGHTVNNVAGKPAVAKPPVFSKDGKKWIIVSRVTNFGFLPHSQYLLNERGIFVVGIL